MITVYAQSDVVKLINAYGTFDNWTVREIEESGIIGGRTKYLYEFFGSPEDTIRTEKEPLVTPEDYLWRTNNVLAVVAGVVKTNNTVFPEKRGNGYCARIETHIEEVNALGIVNMAVTCQGVMMVGVLPEPIRDTKNPMEKVFYGVPFNGRPKALMFDYKADVGHNVVRGTGFSKPKVTGIKDYPEVVFILQKRWEDDKGRIHALRVGTAIRRFTFNAPSWINDYEMKVEYGDITSSPDYKPYMGLKNGVDQVAYYAANSKGRNVEVIEEGWAEPDETPNHMIILFLSSCGEAFCGGIGNTLWIDDVEIVM